MPLAKAARTWEVSPSDVERMIALACEAGDLIVTDGAWEVTDKTHFVSQRTLDSAKSGEDKGVLRDSADFAEKDATLYIQNKRKEDTKEESKEDTDTKPKSPRAEPRKWKQVAAEWAALDPPKAASIEKWCRYKAERKDSPFTPSTVQIKFKRYAGWTPEKFESAVLFSIQKPYQDIYEEPAAARSENQQKAKPPGPADQSAEALDRINRPWAYTSGSGEDAA